MSTEGSRWSKEKINLVNVVFEPPLLQNTILMEAVKVKVI
jgi:hypothetical protein